MVWALPRSLIFGLAVVSVPLGSEGRFLPFAGVDDLAPQPLERFCGKEEVQGPRRANGGALRRCSHSLTKRLEDGGDLVLQWTMHADPTSILSLDTEAQHGVKLIGCGQDRLELELPESHSQHAAEDKFIVGSRFVHGCRHLGDHQLFHRVTRVQRHERRGEGGAVRHRVVLATQELPSFTHVVPYLALNFSYMPAEAREQVQFPQMRTVFGSNKKGLERARRLDDGVSIPTGLLPESVIDALKSKEVSDLKEKWDDGDFHSGLSSNASIDTADGLNMGPKRLSNFGWNWDFNMNTTEQPELNFTVPGASGSFTVRNPYVRAHAGFYMEVASQLVSIESVPLVQWVAGVRGHGTVQARVIATQQTSAPEDVNIFKQFDLPLLGEFSQAKWFGKLDFAAANLPISIEPGVQLQAEMYHKGAFDGSVAVGGRTHGIIEPSLSFDSVKGLDEHFTGHLKDTDLWPPVYMVFTDNFELGVTLRPKLLLRSRMGGFEEMRWEMELKDFLNFTVSRDQTPQETHSHYETKTLTAYPFRVTGLASVELHKRYQVQISINQMSLETSPAVNWGAVEIRDHVNEFDFGEMTYEEVTSHAISVTLIEVDLDLNTENTIGTGIVFCQKLLDGECKPSPTVAQIKTPQGETVAMVELAIVWDANPEAWFATKIRGAAVSFSQVEVLSALTKGPNGDVAYDQEANPLSIHLEMGGQELVVGIAGDITSQDPMHGEHTIDFPPMFTQTWLPCAGTEEVGSNCAAPKLRLYAGPNMVAQGDIPQEHWKGNFLAPSTSQRQVSVGSSVVLSRPLDSSGYSVADSTETVAVVRMMVDLVLPPQSSLFLQPKHQASSVPIGGQKAFIWTIRDVDPSVEYTFSLEVMVMRAMPEGRERELWVNYWQVGGHLLAPIKATQETVQATCKTRPISGMPAAAYPCSFEHLYTFKNTGDYGVGDQVVVVIEWAHSGVTHKMTSPPFEIVQEGAAEVRRLSPSSDWDQYMAKEMAEHSRSCSKKDLHFGFGAGALMRGRQTVKLPDDFPRIGVERPGMLDTGWKDLLAELDGESGLGLQEGVDAAKELPPEVCEWGLCKGALPGCRGGDQKKIHYPDLVFNFNRPFHYSSNSSKTLFADSARATLAYAFSFMPEAIELALKELNATGHLPGSSPPAPPEVPLPAADGHAAVGSENHSAPSHAHEGGWWGSQQSRRKRRLMQNMAGELMPHQIRVSFKTPLPFKLNHGLLEMMVNRGYFEEIHDEKSHVEGPLRITGFRIVQAEAIDDGDTGVPSMWILKEYFQHDSQPKAPAVGDGVLGLALGAGVLVALSVVAGLAAAHGPAREPARATLVRQPLAYRSVEETCAAD